MCTLQFPSILSYESHTPWPQPISCLSRFIPSLRIVIEIYIEMDNNVLTRIGCSLIVQPFLYYVRSYLFIIF